MVDPGEGARGLVPPLFLDQNEARRAKTIFWGTIPPPPSKGLDDQASPLSQGLDPAVCILTWISIRLRLFVLSVLA